jgi:hypothetical protein
VGKKREDEGEEEEGTMVKRRSNDCMGRKGVAGKTKSRKAGHEGIVGG